ncbi:MAG TPA: hypothetical protein VIF10_07510 [Methylobacter sp.]
MPTRTLVPVFGFTASIWVLGEPLFQWKINAAMLVIVGLCINLVGSRIAIRIRPA